MEELKVEFINAHELYKMETVEECFSTGVPEIDSLFGNGIPSATFLEVVGCSSTGKTQLCMQLCAMVQKRKSRRSSVYIDTEGGFSTQRLFEIAHGHFDEVPEDFLNLIKHSRCTDLVQLTSAIYRLQNLLEKNPEISLIVVDSIAMPFRGETDYTKSAITLMANILSRIAVSFRCLVTVVNHVTTRFHSGDGCSLTYLSSALGTSWSQRSCVRAWLCPPKAENTPYCFHLVKSPFSAHGAVFYDIQESGISAVSGKEEK